ncbi:MAG: hypothetical protein KC422_11475 [Trueperaceae bacterium]|nr:hypothetical protein [Trueperaceae bacterium]
MDQITVIGRKGIAHDLLSALQSLGVVQIDPLESSEEDLRRYTLEGQDRVTKDTWDAIVARSGMLIDALSVSGLKPAPRSDIPSQSDELKAYLQTVGSQADQLLAERSELQDELDVAQAYLPLLREVSPSLAQFDESRYLHASAFLAPADAVESISSTLQEVLGEEFELVSQPREKNVLLTVVAPKSKKADLKAAISRAGYSEIVLPERYESMGVAKATHMMEERSQSLPKRLESINAELAKLGAQHGAKLLAANQLASNFQSKYDRLEDLGATRFGIALRGWMPSSERTKVVEGLKKQFGDEIVVDTRAADDHHDHNVPVKLDNPKWVKPFEGLLSLFAPPKYGNFDPSITLAVFFPLFFGIVVGDIGFGLMFAALAWWMRQRGAQGKELSLGILGITINAGALKPISTVIYWCAAWSIVFGFIYGEFFGNFLEKWPENRPVFYVPGHGAEHASDAEHAVAEAIAAESEGVSADHAPADEHAADVVADDHGAAEGEAVAEHKKGLIPIILFRVEKFTPLLVLALLFGILQVLGGWGIRIYYGLKHHDNKHVWEGVGMLGGLGGLVIFAWAYLTGNVNGFILFILFAGLAVFLVGMLMSRVFLMLIELASNAGNILSYLRLFAVGLSAALVANLATDLGFAIGGTLPVIGPILGILVGLAVHLIAIALTIIGHTLQPLRLNYVEFFTKFGFYDESGRPYQPFRLLGGK